MVPNLLIGLREGLEGVLIVSVLVAYLTKSGRRSQLPSVWLGTGLAVALSLGFSALLTFGSQGLDETTEEALAGWLSILAVTFVTWMILWMAKAARSLTGDLHAKLDAGGANPWTLVVIAALAVGREGIETSLFLWAATRTAINEGVPSIEPLAGAVLGIAIAIGIGYALYAGAVRINLSRFFTITAFALIVVAAGVLAAGVNDLQEAGVLPGAGVLAFDVSATITPDSLGGTLLSGVLSFSPDPTVLAVTVWSAYLVVVGLVFLYRSNQSRSVPVTGEATSKQPTSVALQAGQRPSETR